MVRAFLSHSSKDKERYVRIVADALGPQLSIYDEYTFEEGMRPLEEIVRGLDDSQIFVVFLSEYALASEWVQRELTLAHNKLEANLLQRIFPIIIDPKLTHADPSIPEWMRTDYNLKFVSRPTVATRRIRQRLREISWQRNPILRDRNSIFVGRNELVAQIEARVDDVDKVTPICFIASGLPRIGRGTLLRHAFIKCSLARQSYEFPSVLLRRGDSLDDFLLKLHDLGFSSLDYPKDLMNKTVQERTDLLEMLVRDIQLVRETILIQDEGCVISYAREIQPWFVELLSRLETTQRPVFLLASRYRPRPENLRGKDYIFALPVPELNYQERKGLFKRLVELENIQLSRDDHDFFVDQLHGFPDQVKFACDLIKDYGVVGARKQAHQITEYNSEKAAIVLNKYADSQEVLDFLYLLSDFEFISLDFLFSIVDEAKHASLLEGFLAESICDYVGVEREFVRLNDVIRDYVRRNRLEMPEHFRIKIEQHVRSFLSSSNTEERDVSETIYSLKEAIKAGHKVQETYLIPTHFLRSIRELYEERGHLDRVTELARQLLAKEHLLEPAVAQDVRYYLCLSLARQRDVSMLEEVQKIQGPEHNFLLGFYYRLQGRAKDAIDRFMTCLDEPIVSTRAKRELVQVYVSIEDYESASGLAKSNYEDNRRNPFHIQAYFSTVINSKQAAANLELLQRLMHELRAIGSEVANQMADIAQAEYLAKMEGKYPEALDVIEDAVAKYPNQHYPLLSKGFLSARYGDLEHLQSALAELKNMSKTTSISEESLARLEAHVLALSGDLEGAINFTMKNLRRCPPASRDSFVERLRHQYGPATNAQGK